MLKAKINSILEAIPVTRATKNYLFRETNAVFEDTVVDILSCTDFLNVYNPSFAERVYCVLNDIKETIPCQECGNRLPFFNFQEGYRHLCSLKCMENRNHDIPIKHIQKVVPIQDLLSLINRYISNKLHIGGKVKELRPYVKQVRELTSFLPEHVGLTERFYYLHKGKTDINACVNCGNYAGCKVKLDFFHQYCSKECHVTDDTDGRLSRMSRKGHETRKVLYPNGEIGQKISNSYHAAPQEEKDRRAFATSVSNAELWNRTYFDPNFEGFLYILACPEVNAIKIGITKDPKERHKGIKNHSTIKDFECIYLVKSGYLSVSKLERWLHIKYKNKRVNVKGLLSGYTEWFHESILDSVYEDIRTVDLTYWQWGSEEVKQTGTLLDFFSW